MHCLPMFDIIVPAQNSYSLIVPPTLLNYINVNILNYICVLVCQFSKTIRGTNMKFRTNYHHSGMNFIKEWMTSP